MVQDQSVCVWEILVTSDGYSFTLVNGATGTIPGNYEAPPTTRSGADAARYYADVDRDDLDPLVGAEECTEP